MSESSPPVPLDHGITGTRIMTSDISKAEANHSPQSLSVTVAPAVWASGGVPDEPAPLPMLDFWIALRNLLWIICIVFGVCDAIGAAWMLTSFLTK